MTPPTASALTFEPPSPGTWMADRTHGDHPRCRYMQELEREFGEGFRAGFRHYGIPLDTIELGYVHGFPYICVRPIGAPPEAKGPPPKLVFKLLTRLHPELRRRMRRAEQVFAERTWLADAHEFFTDWLPRKRAALLALQRTELAGLTDAALIGQIEAARAEAVDSFTHHFRINSAYMIPVGDLIVHVQGWTGASRAEVLALLEGASTASREGAELARAVALALPGDPELRARVYEDSDAAAVVEALRTAEGELGIASRAWLDVVGHRVFTGFDIGELTGLELPNVLLASLRAALERTPSEVATAAIEQRTAALRDRVPSHAREQFDTLLSDARATYGIRDAHSSGCEMWMIGLARRVLLEAGRRLVDRGLVHAPEHALELRHAELLAALRGHGSVDADELAAYTAYRAGISFDEVPRRLGPPPAPPPPPEWMPPASARLARAVAAYIGSMSDESHERPGPASVRGLPASGGKHIGTARVILAASDFERLGPGDVLVARLTTPAYNVVLPLLGAVVTDRGGVLSHPAIVAREYGIPGVVGTQTATTTIPDGATVEVDGDAGIVKVLR